MPVQGWFPVPIFHDRVSDAPLLADASERVRRLTAGSHTQPGVTGDADSGSNAANPAQYLFLHAELAPVFEAINARVGTFARELGIDLGRESLYLGRAWGNVLRAGSRIALHDHVAATISGVLYLDAAPGTSLRFADPKSVVRKDPHFAAPNAYNFPHVDYPVETGVLLLFPGYLRHGMNAVHTGEEPRVSLAFDYYSVSLDGRSPPPPPRWLVDKLWKKLEDDMKR